MPGGFGQAAWTRRAVERARAFRLTDDSGPNAKTQVEPLETRVMLSSGDSLLPEAYVNGEVFVGGAATIESTVSASGQTAAVQEVTLRAKGLHTVGDWSLQWTQTAGPTLAAFEDGSTSPDTATRLAIDVPEEYFGQQLGFLLTAVHRSSGEQLSATIGVKVVEVAFLAPTDATASVELSPIAGYGSDTNHGATNEVGVILGRVVAVKPGDRYEVSGWTRGGSAEAIDDLSDFDPARQQQLGVRTFKADRTPAGYLRGGYEAAGRSWSHRSLAFGDGTDEPLASDVAYVQPIVFTNRLPGASGDANNSGFITGNDVAWRGLTVQRSGGFAAGDEISLTGEFPQIAPSASVAYSWERVSGPIVPIVGTGGRTARIVAPSLLADASIKFLVTATVTEADGSTTSHTERVAVRVAAKVTAPLAPERRGTFDALGRNRAGTRVRLVSNTVRPNGVTYSWEQVAGPSVGNLESVADYGDRIVQFDAPEWVGEATLLFRVTADDGASTQTAYLQVDTAPKVAAGAEPSASINGGQTLAASSTTLNLRVTDLQAALTLDGPVTYSWR